ncbi:endo-beta-N-acetylglucosaminidase F1 [Elizabethkingia meningoseptica]|uniref:endo-beta-N-acetylglucosaminidase F1 n=1 Tax=Elizabethkingia meningoseptica TaxID=238 RepID=UPI0030197860
MKKHIIQFVANTKKNLFVFLALPFLWTSCRNNTEITESISPNAETAPRSALVTADKASGIKLFSFMEVNDTNPLNNLNFTLKKSGKPLVDMVVLFSANINYDAVNDKVIVSNNSNVQHLLTNKAKYLKPLRDKGMKVILGILGNHDRSGVANLSTERAKQFAQELKKTCELYDLDGVFFDDEYSAYETPPPAGFVTPSNNAAARLAYETKQAMPDKLVTVYVYSRTSSFPNPVDGIQAGKFVDYAIHDYGGTWDLSSNYPGLPKSGMAMASQEFNLNRYASAQTLKNLRTSGYGAHMIFAMDPNRSNFTTKQLPAMKLIAKELYDDELVYTNTPYKKDW